MTNNTRTPQEQLLLDKLKAKNGGQLYDERQNANISNAFAACAIVAMLFDAVMMAYHVIKHHTDRSYPYLAQLLVICVVFCIASLGNKEPGLPATISGHKVDPEKSGKALARRLLACLAETVVSVAAITAIGIYDEGVRSDIVPDTIIFFIIFLAITVSICEFRVHRWRKHQAQLDAEEDDLE